MGRAIAEKVKKEEKLTVAFDEAGGTWKAIGDNDGFFDNAVGLHTRDEEDEDNGEDEDVANLGD